MVSPVHQSDEGRSSEDLSPEAYMVRSRLLSRYAETYGSGDMVDNLIQVGNTVVIEADLNWIRSEALEILRSKLQSHPTENSQETEDVKDQILLYIQEALNLDHFLRMESEFPQLTRFGMNNITALNLLDQNGMLFTEGDLGLMLREKLQAHHSVTTVPQYYKVPPIVAGVRTISEDSGQQKNVREDAGYGRRYPYSGANEDIQGI